ncbi:MAG TPA: extracellular solute-binding protein [Casimicrobiaceae bacterium]|nr:extracellular solute-binding protein [Casimicrobiaceae bacterium]
MSKRREFLRRTAAVGGVAVLAPGLARHAFAEATPKVPSITMVINQSPWFDGFRRLVAQYEQETGNHIELDVNPYAGALDKIRNSLRAQSGSYDLLAIDNNWMVEFFDGGFLAPVHDVNPEFRLDPEVSTYGGTVFWNDKLRTFDSKGGKLMGVPVNGNVEVFYYRKDLYDKHGLEVPETWDEVLANAEKLDDGSRVYGFVHRDDRDSALADFSNYLFSFGGDVFKDASAGDFTVTLNSPAALRALEFYRELGKAGGYPTAGAVSQGQMIQLMATGKAAQAIGIVGAWSQLEDPSKSAVVGKFDAALIPRSNDGRHASRAGHWIGAVAKNVPHDRQLAAIAFLAWFQTLDHQLAYTRYGAVPVRVDLGSTDLARDPKFRFLKAQSENSKVAKMYAVIPEAAQMSSIVSLRLNECIIGKSAPREALNRAAAEVQELVARGGRKTGRLPDLT